MPVLPLQAVRMSAELANPLPSPFPSLKARGIQFRRSQVVMLAGPPNAGKTAVAQIIAHRMGIGALYVSADTELATMTNRLASIMSGDSVEDIERLREAGHFDDVYGADIATSKILYADASSPSPEDISLEMDAYAEMFGAYPELLIIDNLKNVAGSEWIGQQEVMQDLHHMARQTTACLWILHHTSERDGASSVLKPPPRWSIQNRVDELPELILTIGGSNGRIGLAAVKNRNGPADPGAQNPLWFGVDIGRMQLREETYADQLRATGVI